MSIASRINEIREHLTNTWDDIDSLGIGVKILPNEYTQVDYIESSGTQYIDTNYSPNDTTNIYAKCYISDYTLNRSYIFGTYSSGTVNRYQFAFGTITTTQNTLWCRDSDVQKFNSGTYTEPFEVFTNQSNIKIGDNDYTFEYQSSFNDNSIPIYLFANNSANSASSISTGVRIYTLKIYDNNVLVRDFVPCYRNSDNEVGLYDLVNNVFYTNQGTGVFTYGNENIEYIDKNLENVDVTLKKLYGTISNKTDMSTNGIKGDTSQEVIPEEQGTSVSNTSIYVSDVNTDKENTIEISGNTYQETTSGANLMPVVNITKTVNGITLTNNENGTITLNGTATAQVLYPITNTGNNTLRRVPVTENDYKFMLYGDTNVSNDTYFLQVIFGTETETTKFFGATDNGATSLHIATDRSIGYALVIRNGQSFNNHIIKPMGVLSTYTGGFEPYTYGASPNPDYPQNIEVVTGENDITICGKNLFNAFIQAGTYGTATYSVASDGKITQSASDNSGWNISQNRVFYLDEGTYTFSVDVVQGATSNIQIRNLTDNTDVILTNRTSGTFTLNGRKALAIKTYGSAGIYPVSYYIQIEKGSTATPYEPYQGASYPINLPVENLFDKDNANVLNAYISGSKVITESSNDRTIYIPCKPNTTYTIQKILAEPTAQNKFRVCTTSSVPTLGATGIDYVGYSTGATETKITITTSSNANYLCVFMYTFTSAITTTWEQMLSSIQIEQGSKANTYWAYGTTPIELCKIGDYQDRIYNQNDKWYLEKNIGKVVLDGNENWTLGSASSSDYYVFQKNGVLNNANEPTIYCDNFTNIGYQSASTVNDFECVCLNSASLVNSYLRIWIKGSRLSEKTANAFKSWLSTHNTELQFAIPTPTTTEITDTTLISQLNALYNSTLYSTTNINTVASNLLPYIDLTYNKVTPSPSPDRPSEIDTLTGDVDYKISGKNLCNLEKLELLVGTNGNVIHNEYFQNVIINTTNINSLYISGDYTLLSDNALRIGGFNEYPVINSQGTRVTLYENGSVDTTSYDYILLCFAVNTSVIEHTFDEIKNSFMVNIGSSATSYEPYISQTYQIKLGNIELCKINTYEDKIYSNDGKFYLEKNIGKVVLDGSQSESWSYTNVSQGSLFRNSTIITNEITNKNYSPYSNYYKCIPENNYLNRQNNELYIQSTNNYLDIIDNRFTSANDFKTWLSAHNTEVYYILATPTTTEITSDNYPELYESLKQIQDYLVQYKINNEFILDYSSPNIEY